MGIEFTYDFKADHDRLIKTDTGRTITLGRGLDIYEKFYRFSLRRSNQTNRRCKAFSVSINKTDGIASPHCFLVVKMFTKTFFGIFQKYVYVLHFVSIKTE